MKKLSVLTIVCFAFSFWVTSATALPMVADVGGIDPMIAATSLSPSNPVNETNWINDMLGTNFTSTYIEGQKISTGLGYFEWVEDGWDVDTGNYDVGGITGGSDEYAKTLGSAEGYFLVKTGNGTHTHWLFQNGPDTTWATFVVGYVYGNVITAGTFWDDGNSFTYDDVTFNVNDIDSISHLVPFSGSQVPEPATMLLFGTGLIGLAGFRLRKKNK